MNYQLLIVCVACTAFMPFADSFKLFRSKRSTDIPSRCFQPADTGICLAYFLNFHYNPAVGECEEFVYGGCNGNENNFWSKADCEAVCKPNENMAKIQREMMKNAYFLFIVISAVFIANSGSFRIHRVKRSTGNVCKQPPNSGMCMALFINYYYNETTNTCHKFVYGGCGGNDNNFQTGEECTNICGGTVVESDRDSAPIFPPLFSTSLETCDLPPEVGMCRAGFPRYYFNGEKCDTFIYGGCEGNENNFRTLEQCLDKCGHKIADDDNEISNREEE